MIWTLITIILFLIGAYYITKNQIEDDRRIREGIQAIGRKGRKEKQRRYIFVNEEKDYYCPNCGQLCSKEEYEHGFCLDCDQIELFDDFEGEGT